MPRRRRRLIASALVVATLMPAAAQSAGHPADSRAVVNAWSARLNARDDAGLAALFAVPTVIVQGQYTFRLTTRAQVAKWFSTLPCAGRIVSIAVDSSGATAVFRLANRGRVKCDAPGILAAARFEIRNGKIALWAQVPVPPSKKAHSGPVI